MLTDVIYRGPLVSDTGVPGERKSDGIIPVHGNGALQLSRRRWALFFATLDPRGWDAVHSILFQLRADSPDGPVLRERLIASCMSGWDPDHAGISLRKIHGMPMAFGVPKGALLHGKPMPNQNVFAVKWYRLGMLEENGRPVRPGDRRSSSAAAQAPRRLLRLEWMQFRLNDAEDGIEVLQPPRLLHQKGYDEEDRFCSLGPGRFMNHAMTPPIPADEERQVWCEVDTFDVDAVRPYATHGRIAAVEYRWNPLSGLYEWTRTGPLAGIPGRTWGETSISRFGHHWVVAARCDLPDHQTAWFRTDDLFRGLGAPTLRPGSCGPRHSYRCADGVLRIFQNDHARSPYGHWRNPLYVVEVNPENFEYSEPRVVFDARAAGLPFEVPFVDMSKLCPNQGNRQFLAFRTINRTMTTGETTGFRPLDERDFAAAGIHYVELRYDEVAPEAPLV